MVSYKKVSRPFRIAGILIMAAGILFTINVFPFCAPLYDQYHGDRGAVPYQNLIDYAEERGGMVFWAHPDVGGKHKLNDIEVYTPPYYEELLRTYNYTGFSAFVEGMKFSGRPGGIWDRVLKQYVSGERQKPVWAIGELDYKEGRWMGETQTVFLVNKSNKSGILEAMRAGRMYAVRGNLKPVLEAFQIWDDEHGTWIEMGGTSTVRKAIKLKIKVRLSEKDRKTAKLRIIREGLVIKEIPVERSIDVELNDEFHGSEENTYYRIDIVDRLISNPIFVKMEKKQQ